jgi:hypothetical protein
MDKKIDWNKPLQVWYLGAWVDVNNNGVVQTSLTPMLRNKQEPRFVWLNVYDRGQLDTTLNRGEEFARQARSKMYTYFHTLRVNVDTGETEKVYL